MTAVQIYCHEDVRAAAAVQHPDFSMHAMRLACLAGTEAQQLAHFAGTSLA